MRTELMGRSAPRAASWQWIARAGVGDRRPDDEQREPGLREGTQIVAAVAVVVVVLDPQRHAAPELPVEEGADARVIALEIEILEVLLLELAEHGQLQDRRQVAAHEQVVTR